MVIVDITYLKPIEEVDRYLEEHRAFLQKQYDAGLLLASGPKNPRNGGIIIALCDQDTIAAVLLQDPFTIHGIAKHSFIEFTPVKFHQSIKTLLGK